MCKPTPTLTQNVNANADDTWAKNVDESPTLSPKPSGQLPSRRLRSHLPEGPELRVSGGMDDLNAANCLFVRIKNMRRTYKYPWSNKNMSHNE